MTITAIPSWTASGVLPPVNESAPTSRTRSPYEVTLDDLVGHFNGTPERKAILAGLLDFRAALHRVGIVRGFQWLDGSFVENVEALEERPPRDIDVVTFFHAPSGETQESLAERHPVLFNKRETKTRYLVDAYFVQMDAGDPMVLVSHSTYWYSLWAHRRSGEWKGYLRIDLAPAKDPAARASMSGPSPQGGEP